MDDTTTTIKWLDNNCFYASDATSIPIDDNFANSSKILDEISKNLFVWQIFAENQKNCLHSLVEARHIFIIDRKDTCRKLFKKLTQTLLFFQYRYFILNA